ncbi:MAG: RNA-binding cell elongation regulator Jag/EloR [Bacilli bacterium]|nr:RNA-binding cell elongation regulator Jag/EloR [Bacilli bacterium]
MQRLKKHRYEGKNSEEVLNQALKELNASTEEVYYDVTEEVTGGLFKSKKYVVSILLKNDVIDYVKAYLKEVTELMGLKVDFESQKRENYIKINMISDSNAILIGKNGRTMKSLQDLLRQSIQTQVGVRVNIILDTNEYKEKQQRSIERLAIKLAKDVVKTGVEVKMDSMNSFERRLVHNALNNFKGVATESVGEEPDRYVIIKPLEK